MKRILSAFNNLKFRNKLVCSTMLVALIPLLLLSVIIAAVWGKGIRRQTTQLTLQMVGQTGESLDIYIHTIEKFMDLVIDVSRDDSGENTTRLQNLKNLSDSILRAYPEIAGFCVALEDEQYFGAGMNRISRDLFQNEDWWQYAMKQDGRLGVVGSVVGRNVINNMNDSSDSIFALVKAFSYGAGNQQHGVVMFDIRHTIIQQMINRVSIGEGGFLFVADAHNIVYAPPNPIVYRIDRDSYQQDGSNHNFLRIKGVDYFIANRHSDYSGWRIVGVVPRTEFTAGIRSIYQGLTVCVLLCLLLVIVVSIAVSSTVTRPISKLSHLMEKVEKGDFSLRFEVRHQDEIGILASSFNHMLERIGDLIHELYEEKQISLEAQLKSLQEQIKPHFLYNTLDTISWMARAQNAQDVVRLVDALTHMFRVGLSSGRSFITLQEEKSHIASYLYIQKVRYRDRLQYSIEIPEAYDHLIVPKLILQPLVENSIYHGIKMKRGGGHIYVTATVEKGVLYLSILDDGAGIPADRLEVIRSTFRQPKEHELGSFGLSYIARRIELSYGAPYGMEINSREGFCTEVSIRLPVREDRQNV